MEKIMPLRGLNTQRWPLRVGCGILFQFLALPDRIQYSGIRITSLFSSKVIMSVCGTSSSIVTLMATGYQRVFQIVHPKKLFSNNMSPIYTDSQKHESNLLNTYVLN